MEKRKNGALYRNFTSYLGIIINFISIALIIATLVWQYSIKTPSPYIGIFTFLIFPSFLIFGIFLVFLGMFLESRRRKKYQTEEALPYPILDLNKESHRKKFLIFTISGTFLSILLGFTGYNAFIFTESVTFCGRICHKVMEPEYKAYLKSPHARVTCAKCHVGEGAKWYAKSKISGLKQVYAVLFNTYEKPIPTPIKSLRVARETCEECHWPQKFYGAQLLQIFHFRYDENNTPEQISLILKTGGGTKIEKNAGIHWHMLLHNKIYFKPADEKYQVIPFIKAIKEDGSITIYYYKSTELKKEEIERLPLHEMDCMDCHNRPTHIFLAPEKAVDNALSGGHISKDLPYIKKISVDLLTKNYTTKEQAMELIKEDFLSFYQKNYPEIFKKEREKIDKAILILQEIFKANVFPEMNVNWETYPSNIGHRNWAGCFRCHDGNHISEDGKTLTMECSICHTMPQRGPQTPLGAEPSISNVPWHPIELKGKHYEILCNKCHSAGYRPPVDCAECHKLNKEDSMISMGCDTCHLEEGKRTPQNDCNNCHTKLKGTHLKGMHREIECKDCHKPHFWKVDGGKNCFSCHSGLKEHSQGKNCLDCHSFK